MAPPSRTTPNEDYAKAWGLRVHRTYSDMPSRHICQDQRKDPASETVRFDGPAPR
jgi:hypothetical protein